VEGARRYGVVVAPDGGLDVAATDALRAQMRAERGDGGGIFNFGGTIEEIKARCQQETHLPPPQEPEFRRSGAA
jgi:N-methylhydantoinase B